MAKVQAKKRKKARGRKRPIITGFLEKVGSTIFDRHSKIIAEMVQGRQGLYALYRKDKLYYVGLARNLRSRINQHLKDKHAGKWTHFSLYVIQHPDHVKELESLLLRIADPAGNKVRGQLRRSADMLPILKKKTKAAAISEWKRNFETASQAQRRARQMATGKKPQQVAWATRKAARPCKGLFPRTLRIYGTYKGVLHKGWLRPSGLIKFEERNYYSPSEAAFVARGNRRTNGWAFWKVKQGKDLVSLSEIRRKRGN